VSGRATCASAQASRTPRLERVDQHPWCLLYTRRNTIAPCRASLRVNARVNSCFVTGSEHCARTSPRLSESTMYESASLITRACAMWRIGVFGA
jgi:hypothetical protein